MGTGDSVFGPILYPLFKATRWLLRKVIVVALIIGPPVAALMYWRGYLYFENSIPLVTGMPAIHEADGIAYRKFDMNMEFRDRNIWTKPKKVQPDSYVDGGPIWNANLVCAQGNFTVRGDLKDSRVTVPNGTLIIEGSVSGSFIAARHIITRGLVEKTVESGTLIMNSGTLGSGNRRIDISRHNAVVGFVPWPFAPHEPLR